MVRTVKNATWTATCEQAILTSANQTLQGGGGFGLVAHSAGWPGGIDAGSNLTSFMPQGAASLVANTEVAPHSLAYRQTEAGPMVWRKTMIDRDAFGRPGNYLMHVLLDTGRVIDPRMALSLWNEPALLNELPAPLVATRELPPVSLSISELSEVHRLSNASDWAVDAALSAVLEYFESGRRVAIQSARSLPVAMLIRDLLWLLPAKIASECDFDTYHANPLDSGVLITGFRLADCPRARLSSMEIIDLDSIAPYGTKTSRRVQMVRRVLKDGLAFAESDIDTVNSAAELVEEAELAALALSSPADLKASQIARIVARAPSWLYRSSNSIVLVQTLLREPSTAEVLLATWSTFPDDVQESIASSYIEFATKRVLSGEGEASGGEERIVSMLTLDKTRWGRELIASALARVRSQNLSPKGLLAVWPQLDVFLDDGDRSKLVNLPGAKALVLQSWTRSFEIAFCEYLSSPDERWTDAIGNRIDESPERAFGLIREALERGYAVSTVVNSMRILNFEDLTIAKFLLECDTEQLLHDAMRFVANLEEDVRSSVLSELWQDIASGLGIPQRISSSLVVRNSKNLRSSRDGESGKSRILDAPAKLRGRFRK